jgi:archaellum component FlaC
MPEVSHLSIEIDSSGVMKATGNLELLKNVFGKVGKGSDDVAKKMGALQLVAGKLPGPLKSVASGLMGLVSPSTAVVGALLEVGEAAVKYVKESLDAFAKFEMIKTNLEVVCSSAEEASRTFSQLQSMAGRTPFNVDQLSEAAVMLRQSGVAAKDLIPTLTMLGNVAGGSSEKFGRIAQNYAQIQSVMKATSMDLRQFAMAGVPIYKMLEEMGVTGTASAEDIEAAFKRMTEAGGQFEGAMAKGSQTLQGMRTKLEGLREQTKALQAEYSGMANASKSWTEANIRYHAALNEHLQRQIELKGILDKKETGTATAVDKHREAELRVAEIKSQIEERKNITHGRALEYNGIALEALQKQLVYWTAVEEALRAEKDIQDQINERLARHNDEVERREKGYRDLKARAEEYYAKSNEGKREAIQKEIEYFKKWKESKRLIDVMSVDTRTGQQIVVGKREAEIEAKELEKIDAALVMLYEDLANVGKKKHEFAEWVEILASATGFKKEDVESLNKLGTVKKFAAEVENIQSSLLQDNDLLAALGLDKLDVLESSAERVRSALEKMISSGQWKGKEKEILLLIKAVKGFDEAASESRFADYIKGLREEIARLDSPELQALESAKKALEGAGMKNPTDDHARKVLDAAYDRDLKDLEIRRKSLRLSEDELRIKELAAKYGDEKKARAVLRGEQDLDFEQYRKELLLKLESIGLSKEELRIKELAARFGNESFAQRAVWLEQENEKTQALIDARERLRGAGLDISDEGRVNGLKKEPWNEKNAGLAKALGMDNIGALESAADKIRSELESLLNSGMNGTEEQVRDLIATLSLLDEITGRSKFKDFIKEMKEETELLGKSPVMRALSDAKKTLESQGLEASGENIDALLDAKFEKEMALLQLKEKQLGMSEKQLAMEKLIAEFGSEAAAQAVYNERQKQAASEALKNSLEQLKDAGRQMAVSGLVDFANDLGKAFRDGAISSDDFSGALRNMVKSLVDAMPQLLLNVGLQLMTNAATWKMGLGFIAASGLMSFVSGMIGDSEKSGREDEAEKLRQIQQQITDLIEQQRKQEEYYLTKRRSLNAGSAMSVNDAIITPKGLVYTHPEDYIIATKRPESLMGGGGGGDVYVNIQNNAPVHVETRTETADDGTKVLKVVIDKVKDGIAGGEFDGALGAYKSRTGGRGVRN